MLCAAFGITIGSTTELLHLRIAPDPAAKFGGLVSPCKMRIGKSHFATCSQVVGGAGVIAVAVPRLSNRRCFRSCVRLAQFPGALRESANIWPASSRFPLARFF